MSRSGSMTDSIFPTIHPFGIPHCTIFARISSARAPVRRAAPCTRCCNSMQPKHKHCHPRSRTHCHSVVRDAHHSYKGLPVRHSITQVSEANVHRACDGHLECVQSIWSQLGHTPHLVMQWAYLRPYDFVRLFLYWYTSSFNRLEEAYVAFNA